MRKIKLLNLWQSALLITVLLCTAAAAGSFGKEKTVIYSSHVFKALWVCFFISMSICTLRLFRGNRDKTYKWGVSLIHMGVMVVLVGACGNMIYGCKGKIYLLEGMQQEWFIAEEQDRELGFAIVCDDFATEYYDELPKAKSYTTSLSITDGTEALKAIVDVNKPFKYKGITFFQYDYGIEPTAKITFSYTVNYKDNLTSYTSGLDEEIKIDGHSIRVTDFSPSLGINSENKFFTFNPDLTLNPGALFEITKDGKTRKQWLLKKESQNSMEEGNISITFNDYKGIEYSVLGVSKAPFNPLFYMGFILIPIGFIVTYKPKKEARHAC